MKSSFLKSGMMLILVISSSSLASKRGADDDVNQTQGKVQRTAEIGAASSASAVFRRITPLESEEFTNDQLDLLLRGSTPPVSSVASAAHAAAASSCSTASTPNSATSMANCSVQPLQPALNYLLATTGIDPLLRTEKVAPLDPQRFSMFASLQALMQQKQQTLEHAIALEKKLMKQEAFMDQERQMVRQNLVTARTMKAQAPLLAEQQAAKIMAEHNKDLAEQQRLLEEHQKRMAEKQRIIAEQQKLFADLTQKQFDAPIVQDAAVNAPEDLPMAVHNPLPQLNLAQNCAVNVQESLPMATALANLSPTQACAANAPQESLPVAAAAHSSLSLNLQLTHSLANLLVQKRTGLSPQTIAPYNLKKRGRLGPISSNAECKKHFDDGFLNGRGCASLMQEWNTNHPEYPLIYRSVTNYKIGWKQRNNKLNPTQSRVDQDESEHDSESDQESDDEEEASSSHTVTPVARKTLASLKAGLSAADLNTLTASQKAPSPFKDAVHVSCMHEECKLHQSDAEQIGRLPFTPHVAKNIETVKDKILSCPDLSKHTVNGIPLATYIFTNTVGRHWDSILEEIKTKYGTDILNYTNSEGKTNLHWLMISTRSGQFSNNLIGTMNPNAQDKHGMTPLQNALQFLVDNPDLATQSKKLIRDHIVVLRNNKKFDTAQIGKCLEIIEKMPSRTRSSFSTLITMPDEKAESDDSDTEMTDVPPLIPAAAAASSSSTVAMAAISAAAASNSATAAVTSEVHK